MGIEIINKSISDEKVKALMMSVLQPEWWEGWEQFTESCNWAWSNKGNKDQLKELTLRRLMNELKKEGKVHSEYICDDNLKFRGKGWFKYER